MQRLAIPAGLFFFALVLFTVGNGFPLGFHPDEVAWTNNVLNGHWDLEQPLLLRETVALIVAATRVSEPQHAVEIGRWVCAAAMAGGIAGLFIAIRARAGEAAASIASAAAALTPLAAIHAHYFKDDAPLFCCCTLAVLAFRRFLAAPVWKNFTLLGLALGAAVSSKEPGLFLVAVFGLTILTQPRREWRTLIMGLAIAVVIAAAVFVIADIPMLLEPGRTATELGDENRGIFTGHWDGVVYAPWFHFTRSLWQGVGPAFMAVATLGLALAARRSLAHPIDRLMVIYAALFYAVIELSPLKPGPDAGRYALPLLVPLAYFFGLAVGEGRVLLAGAWPRWRRGMALAVCAVATIVALIAGVSTARLTAGLDNDTRLQAGRLLAGKDAQIVTEMFGVGIGRQVRSLADVNLSAPGPAMRYLVASSLLYGRYEYGAAVGGAGNAAATDTWTKYQAIFASHFYCEIRPAYMTYAMSNPTIRVIDLSAPPRDGAPPACRPNG